MQIKIFICFLLLYQYTETASVRTRSKRSLSYYYTKQWTNNTIPYLLDSNFSEDDLFYLKRAISTIEQETCLVFTPYRKEKHPNWVKIEDSTICHSAIGMEGTGQQHLYLASNCRSYGLILHELMHTIGFLHEMMRPDRDEYIHYHINNVQDNAKDSFKVNEAHYKLHNTPFDFQSVTMYGRYDFSKNGRPVWSKINKTESTRVYDSVEKDLSYWDAFAVNKLYNCAKNCKENVNCTYPNFVNSNCQCQTIKDFAIRRCVDEEEYEGICKNASITNVCYNRPKISSVICRKTCGRCFHYKDYGKTDAPPKTCVDINEIDCQQKKLDGYCYVDTWTKVNCKKSCGRCDTNSNSNQNGDVSENNNATSELICQNLYDHVLCKDWAHHGQCDINPSFMLAQCALSCNVCNNSDGNNSVTEKVPCRNYSPDSYCDTIAVQNKCQGTTLRVCLGSCGKCGMNYERTMNDTVSPHDHKEIKANEECIDRLNDCKHFVNLGYCELYKDSMNYHCAKSCNACQKNCTDEDYPAVCKAIKQRGYCKSHAGFAARCRKTCLICLDPSKQQENTKTKVNCVDLDNKYICKELVRRRQCQATHDLALYRCRRSCNLCNVPQSSQSTSLPKTISIPPCVDEDLPRNCQYLVDNSLCDTYIQRALLCQKSCNLCLQPKTTMAITTATPEIECKDVKDPEACRSWADSNYCETIPEYMRQNCAKSCNFCSNITSNCLNIMSDKVCKEWAATGYCNINPTYMKTNCEKACDFCDNKEEISCTNEVSDSTCDDWSTQGYCLANEEYMRDYCKKSCKFCN